MLIFNILDLFHNFALQMIILYGVAVTSTRCRFGFGYRNRKFPRKETGVYTQGNDSVYVRKQQFPRKETGVSTA